MKAISFDRLFGVDGEHRTPYMTRLRLGRLRLHIFHRGDADPDCHDHPWDFWTFPLTAYVEEVVRKRVLTSMGWSYQDGPQETIPGGEIIVFRQVVPAFRWSFRPAVHTHRVLGRFDEWTTLELLSGAFVAGQGRVPPQVKPGRIVTIVWQGWQRRKWGFLKSRDGRWCWTPWKEYAFGGGKHAPCEPHDRVGGRTMSKKPIDVDRLEAALVKALRDIGVCVWCENGTWYTETERAIPRINVSRLARDVGRDLS